MFEGSGSQTKLNFSGVILLSAINPRSVGSNDILRCMSAADCPALFSLLMLTIRCPRACWGFIRKSPSPPIQTNTHPHSPGPSGFSWWSRYQSSMAAWQEGWEQRCTRPAPASLETHPPTNRSGCVAVAIWTVCGRGHWLDQPASSSQWGWLPGSLLWGSWPDWTVSTCRWSSWR